MPRRSAALLHPLVTGPVVLVLTALGSTACSGGPTDERPPGPGPTAAWLDAGRDLHVMADGTERVVDGRWEPFLWLSTGDLLIHTPADSSGMAVYRPSNDELVARTDEEWSSTATGGEEFGLDGERGAPSATEGVVRIVEGDDWHENSLVTFGLSFEELDVVDLPPAADPGSAVRRYATPVRVGTTTLVAFADETLDFVEEGESAVVDAGIVRVEGDDVAAASHDATVEALHLSADGTSVLATTTDLRVLRTDPATGAVLADLGPLPVAPPGEVEQVDAVRERVVVRVRTDGAEPVLTTWLHDGAGWSRVGEAGTTVWWQDGGTVIRTEDGLRWEPDAGGRQDVATGPDLHHVVVPGSIVPPG